MPHQLMYQEGGFNQMQVILSLKPFCGLSGALFSCSLKLLLGDGGSMCWEQFNVITKYQDLLIVT